MPNKTGQKIYDMAQDLVKIDGSTIGIAGLEEARALEWINDLNSMFFGEYYGRGLQAPDYMRAETGFNAVTSTDLDGAVLQNATTIDLTDASDFDSSGAIVIRNGDQFDIVEYTGKTSNQLTGVTGVNYDHSDAETVYKLYALPSDYGRLRKGRKTGHGVTVAGVPYYDTPHLPSGREFTELDLDGTVYLWIENTGDVLVEYDKKPTTLTSMSDTVDVPLPYDYYIIHGLVKLFKEIEDQDYNGQKEDFRMLKIIQDAIAKENIGRTVRAGVKYFQKKRSPYCIRYV